MRIKSAINFDGGDSIASYLCNNAAWRLGINGTRHDDGDFHPLYDDTNILRQSRPVEQLTEFSAAFMQRLKLFSPRAWWGLIDLESKKPNPTFGISVIVASAMGLFLPLLFLWFFAIFQRGHSKPKLPSPRLLFVTLISPWSLNCLYELYCQLSAMLVSLRKIFEQQLSTLTRATDVLKLRIRHGRAYRTLGYDVYLPPSLASYSVINTDVDVDASADADTKTPRALLFIPGASVSHEAYSEVAARLSDKGFVVAVMSLEPLRLAGRYFGTNFASVQRIIGDVTSDIFVAAFSERQKAYLEKFGKLPQQMLPIKTVKWTLMGHSLGAFAAMQLFRELVDNPNKKHNLKLTSINVGMSGDKKLSTAVDVVFGKKMVLWGVAAFVNFATDLSDQKDAKILVIQGTNDDIVDMTRSLQGELDACFPSSTRTEHIAGGTHQGFGSYKSVFLPEKNGSKKKCITLDQQHKRACHATVRFLRS